MRIRTLSLNWKGARQGLITSGLNHIASSAVEKKTDYANDDKGKKKGRNTIDTGDVLNWFDEEIDMGLWNYAEQSYEKKGVLEIHAHGNRESVRGYYYRDIEELNNTLSKSSPAWKSFRDDGKSLTLKLYSCNTGKPGGIAQSISRYYPRLTVIAPTHKWTVNYFFNPFTGAFIGINRVFIVTPGRYGLRIAMVHKSILKA